MTKNLGTLQKIRFCVQNTHYNQSKTSQAVACDFHNSLNNFALSLKLHQVVAENIAIFPQNFSDRAQVFRKL